ncbi:SDR family oxidoreductase [uncultured Roseibium sp.]|uniref:SDR family oxidoreductase n=1 Tax=uncultured Roseibium sp. TaxID=1936171 RepID=UPI0032179115
MTAGKAYVLGGYGFIGASCIRALKRAGYDVTGVGRSLEAGLASDPGISWLERDIARTDAATWKQDLADADVVINASGALQDGARDSLKAIHETAVAELIAALKGSDTRFIQISAAGVAEEASTDFFQTKARGDALIAASDLNWIVLRPVLVIGPEAYGGTALLRASAAMPGISFAIQTGVPVQTVFVEDLAAAVVQAASGELGAGFIADLTEDEPVSFGELTSRIRAWLGYKPWRYVLPVPDAVVRLIGRCADALGWLGWRSPLRTNALKALAEGIVGDPSEWKKRGGRHLRSLEETLQAMPATPQERMFSRLFLLLPAAIAALALFWVLSGLFGFISFGEAAAVLTDKGVSDAVAGAAVLGGSVIDIGLGLAILNRKWTRRASLGMLVVSLAYLIGGSLIAPELWADPLGPLVKVLPAMVLALFPALLLERR